MGRQDKFREKKVASYKRELKNLDSKTGRRDSLIVFSLRNFDNNQGQTFIDWEKEQLLALAVEKLKSLCQYSVPQAINEGLIKIYTKVPFPPESGFTHPRHVPPDVDWASMHVQGKPCIIGFFEDNIFHVVFLDKEHQFWISKKKNT
jgi:hypothetical protein